jgi:biotin---protein ligase
MSSPKRLNVLIYSGPGTTPTSIRHATYTLRLLLGSHYAITTITDTQILKEPWAATCALLVVPGGADMSYCRTLNGQGNRIIKQYVQLGGSYLGLCAGGYYGSGRCEFEIGKRGMEVAGDRELAFFPGTCRGLVFPGFKYGREDGALAVKVKAYGTEFKSYYNGGGLFVDAEMYKQKGVEVLATFSENVAVEIGEDQEAAAIVLCKVGDGKVVLTGPHPEYVAYVLAHDCLTTKPSIDSHRRTSIVPTTQHHPIPHSWTT